MKSINPKVHFDMIFLKIGGEYGSWTRLSAVTVLYTKPIYESTMEENKTKANAFYFPRIKY